MEMVQRTLEVERVVNLIAAFGWKVDNEEVRGDEITITIKKTVGPGLTPSTSV